VYTIYTYLYFWNGGARRDLPNEEENQHIQPKGCVNLGLTPWAPTGIPKLESNVISLEVWIHSLYSQWTLSILGNLSGLTRAKPRVIHN